jgi:hypothetical protein
LHLFYGGEFQTFLIGNDLITLSYVKIEPFHTARTKPTLRRFPKAAPSLGTLPQYHAPTGASCMFHVDLFARSFFTMRPQLFPLLRPSCSRRLA